MIIRIFDILLSALGILILLPFSLLISVLIMCDSHGGVFYTQTRVGKNNRDFKLIKFRTMATGSDKSGSLTVGTRDIRITRIGYYLRKHKLDELTQLINVLSGDMSLVGPRPELRKYVDLYNSEQKEILNVKPGITDYASIQYSNENALLAFSKDPEKTYIEEIMPAKISLNMTFFDNPSVRNYFHILFLTVKIVFRNK